MRAAAEERARREAAEEHRRLLVEEEREQREAAELLARQAAAEAEQALRAAAEERAHRQAAEEAARKAAAEALDDAARKAAAAATQPRPETTNGQVRREAAPVLRLAGARARLAAVRDRTRPDFGDAVADPEVERPIGELPLSAWLQASNGTGDRQAVSEWAEALRNKRPKAETG
jgi:membrane protein involved in colicin uptake